MSGRLYSAFLTFAVTVSFNIFPAWAEDVQSATSVSARIFSPTPGDRKSSYEVVISRLKDRSLIPSTALLRTEEAEESSEGLSTYGVNVASYKAGASEVLIRGGITADKAYGAAVQVQVVW